MYAYRNITDGTFARVQGKGQVSAFDDESATPVLGPRATLTISGVGDAGTLNCCASGSLYRMTSFTTTNRSYCLGTDRNRTGSSGVVPTLFRWSEAQGAPAFTESMGIIRCSDGVNMGAQRTDTAVCYCSGTWTVYRWVAVGGGYLIFYGSKVDDGCWPVVIPNSIDALSPCTVIAKPAGFCVGPWSDPMTYFATGGTATIDFACCGDNSVLPVINPATTNIDKIRSCCEVFDVTLAGGTLADGFYRMTKGSWGTGSSSFVTGGWFAPVNIAKRHANLYQSGTTWFLDLLSSTGTTRFSQSGGATCPTNSPWSLVSNTNGGTPSLTVETRQCW